MQQMRSRKQLENQPVETQQTPYNTTEFSDKTLKWIHLSSTFSSVHRRILAGHEEYHLDLLSVDTKHVILFHKGLRYSVVIRHRVEGSKYPVQCLF